MLRLLFIFEGAVAIGAIFLGVVSGAVTTVVLKLHAEGIWKDMLLGLFGFEIVRFWPGLGAFIISVLGLDRLAKDWLDQFIVAGALVAVTLPALRHVVRFARERRARK